MSDRAVPATRPDVLEVKLLGSLAGGEARPGSDADLFVTVRDNAGSFLDRLPGLGRAFSGGGIGCDIVAFTESETRALRDRGDAFARVIFEEAMSLAHRT